jgi:outer membrane protein assembly factor BamA
MRIGRRARGLHADLIVRDVGFFRVSPRRSGRPSRARAAALAGSAIVCVGCASIEPARYGIQSLSLEGNRSVSESAITECLITRERDRFQLGIGLSEPACGVPPFDSSPVRLRLWRWPWAEWPSFNRAVFDRDLEGVLRFYRARGYYAAKVVEVRYRPDSAATNGAAGRCEAEDCRLDVSVVVDEGEPTLIAAVSVAGLESLPVDVQRSARAAVLLGPGQPPDEALHDRSKQNIKTALYDTGWAGVTVKGHVALDPARRRADIAYRVEPGPRYRFGRVQVHGNGNLPRDVIEKAANLAPGQDFDPEVLREMQAEVFALGAFSAVEVEEALDPARATADVRINVTPLPPDALRVGAGVLSGAARRTDTGEVQSIPQWDVHLFGRYQRRHLFGSLGQLTIEDRPRLIFSSAFPGLDSPRPGNVASVALTQPGWLEARTTTFVRTVWDYGPDPYLDFFRSDLFLRVGATRGFWRRQLIGTFAVQQDLYSVLESGTTGIAEPEDEVDATGDADGELGVPSSYRYTYLEQDLRLDLRDSRTRPRAGAYFALNATESVRWPGSDWTAFRIAPEVRAYVPLPLDIVFAQRVALASLFVFDSNASLDEDSRALGPNNYRLRGGGASSNRGFLAGTLGVGLDGGTRRWETSFELRVPIGQSFVVAGFADFGDVSRTGSFRLNHLNTTLGYGLRYHTVIGAIRFDVGYRVPAWQRADGSDGIEADANTLLFSDAPGAMHLTIGDPF